MKKTLLAIAILSITTPAIAQYEVSESNILEGTPVGLVMKDQGIKVHKHASINDHLKGHLIELETGSKEVVFTDPKGMYLYSGDIVDFSKGQQSLSMEVTDLLNPAPDYKEVAKQFEDKGLTINTSEADKPTLSVFFSLDCGFCMKAYAHMKESGVLNDPDINIQFVPLAGPSTYTLWQGIYNKENKLKAFDDAIAVITKANDVEIGKLREKATQETLDGLKLIASLSSDLRIQGTPTFIHYNEEGKQVVESGFSPAVLNQAYQSLKNQ
ncbi:MAG: thioredoxin fold domain-containing protein [Methyloprofundus sp.]|nr:thioredoxin fold domain-containing protein [Methyloprofundus sp.]